MGTNFFRDGFGETTGKFLGQSGLKWAAPITKTVGKIMDPSGKILNEKTGYGDPMAKLAQGYREASQVGTAPTPFAGKQPTLADANRGYVLASQNITQGARPNVAVPVAPPPRMTF